MKPSRRVLCALLLVLLALPLLADNPEKSEKSPREALAGTVNITVESSPSYGEVWIEGKFVGSAPLTFHFQPGTHNIEVRRAGSEPWRRELTVYAYNPASVVAILLPEKKEK